MNSVNSFICMKRRPFSCLPGEKRSITFEEFSSSEALAKFFRGRWHKRFKPIDNDSKPSDRFIKKLSQLLVLALLLHLPRFCPVNALVKSVCDRPQRNQGIVKPEILHCVMKSGRGFRDLASVNDVASGFGDRFYSADKVAEVIGEICIVKRDQSVFAIVAVFKWRHGPQQVVPEWIYAILLRLSQGVNHIAEAF